uniref:RRM domain-containing protein n=1 Tax=Kalanchoe fedtschenkoi TaxID=63787 RepID=A0A7N0TYZ1_KALFE
MGKKSKQPEAPSFPENAAVPSIFDKLFGDVPKGDDSIFADDNPFRRKKAESLPQEQQVQANGDDVSAEDAKPEVKGKRKKDKNYGKVSADGASTEETLEAESKSKKSKKEEVSEGNGEMRNGGMGEEDDERKVEKKKKKRKRDELEKEYEKRVYGAVEEEKPVVGKKRKKVDDPATLMVAKEEGFDDETKLMRTVFVGNLPLKMKKKSLLKEFGQFGEIDSIRIRSVPIVDSKTPRKGAIMKKQINEAVDSVHAYIVFKTEEFAQASLQHNMAVVGGNHIRVDRACPPRKKLKGESGTPIYDNKRTVFVGNLPFDVQDEELYRLFCGIKQLESSVEAVRVIRDPHSSLGKGIAYVLFKTREAAISALKRRNLKLRERELRLSRAKADSTPAPKRKSPMSPSSDNSSAKKFARNSSGASSGSYSGVKTAVPLSYQGVRASKSGTQKRTSLKRPAAAIPQPKSQRVEKVKVRSTKRPAVAARKAKALNVLSASKQGAKKRKPDTDSTPSSSHKHKRVRKF